MLKIPPLAGFFLPEFSADDPRHKKSAGFTSASVKKFITYRYFLIPISSSSQALNSAPSEL
ncbi:hypothetical protein STM14_2117 [Salmonella enterica subsp. enterica serovar Typhimurium str. 14028S]|uniref:Uncharacterized protein n=1 Tax=Salmonella typhimurium (strain 14028s / SGSC 2262) TaxID=588858 RepID=A0A0F6B245_SALT1|nr:hypothetical protein STM14_2117 [Salmonella enterica subsp. enterica serovar Typhimurium str. 14028S]